jgi:hypothetical protein
MFWLLILIFILFGFILYQKQRADNHKVNAEHYVKRNNSISLSPYELLKNATKRKKTGDYEGGIRLLREAYRKIERGTITYPIDTYLRLPLFLFDAGHRDEAWMEYNRLLIDGIHGDSANVVPMNRSKVYDKMRLMLQKEGKPEYAVQFGIFSYLSWLQGLHFQKRVAELEELRKRDEISGMLTPLLKKCKQTSKLKQLTEIVLKATNQIPKIDFDMIDLAQ